jgi:hypothetical protein
MITAIVEFQLPAPMAVTQAKETFLATAPKYRGVSGLVRKYYFLSEDGARAGGIYLWETQADADRVYTEAWKAFVRAKYGSEPRITYFATPVVVDNVLNEIVTDG